MTYYIKFSMSSIMSGVLDFLLLWMIQFFTSNLFLSVAGARVCSAAFNYTVNRLYVFSRFRNISIKTSLPRYIILAIIIMLANYVVIGFFYGIIELPLLWSKILTEITIFSFSYWYQRNIVFQNKGGTNEPCL